MERDKKGCGSAGLPGQFRSLNPDQFSIARRGKSFVRSLPHVTAWTAVSPTELAQEDVRVPAPGRNGVFTLYFANGLLQRQADANGNGVITGAELLTYLQKSTQDYCAQFRCESGKMTPALEPSPAALLKDLTAWRPGQAQPQQSPQPPAAPPPVAATDVIPPYNPLGIKVEMLPQAQVRLGDKIKLRVTSPKEGDVIVLDVRDSGKVVQLFPSVCAHKERLIRANAPLTLPDAAYGCEFTASEAGTGQILVIVSEDNVALDALLNQHKDLGAVPNGQDYLAAIARQLLAVWRGDERNRPVRWGLATARYRVDKR